MKGRTIVITSGKGGVGKTTATANIGTGLAMRGHRVVVVDTDIGLRNLDVIMGLENRIVYDLVNVIEGDCKLNQAMIADKHDYELYLIPAAQTRDKNSISPEQLREMCEELEKEFDYVLIDCPAGIEQGFKNATAAAQEAIIVTTPEVSAIRDADRNSLSVKSPEGKELDSLTPLADVHLEMEVEVLVEGFEGNFGFAFMKSAEEPVASFLTTDIDQIHKGPFKKGDIFTVSLTIKNFAMRVGDFYVLGGLADKTGLLWYETKFSKSLHVEPNKGVGSIIMNSEWSISQG